MTKMDEMIAEAVAGTPTGLVTYNGREVRSHRSVRTLAEGCLVVKPESRARLGTANKKPVFVWTLNGHRIKAADAEAILSK